MQTKEAILYALNLSDRAVLSVIDEMSDAPTISNVQWRMPSALGDRPSRAR